MSYLTKRSKSIKVSAAQLLIMLGFFEKNPALISGKLSSNFTSADRRRGWEELAAQLNSCGVGPQKNVVRWRKCWTDQKCLIKAKAARIRTHTQTTGGPAKERLNDLEERILNVCSTMSSSGNDSIQEGGLTQCFMSQNGGLSNEDPNLSGIESPSSDEVENGTPIIQETPKIKEEESLTMVPEIIRIESISTLNAPHSLPEAEDTPIPSTSTLTTLVSPPRFSYFNYSMRKKKDPSSSTVKAAAAIEETNAAKIKYYQEKLELKKKLFEFKKTEHQLQIEFLKEKINFVQSMVKAVKTSINISNFMLD